MILQLEDFAKWVRGKAVGETEIRIKIYCDQRRKHVEEGHGNSGLMREVARRPIVEDEPE